MAINTSNSNYVNISNLPQTQQVFGNDLLIVQTDGGTSTITFNDFNVVKTDAAGNATVAGTISGLATAQFTTLSASNDVRAVNYYANNVKGYYGTNAYYNRFTLNGGLVTTASYVLGSPEYNLITQTIIPNVTAWQNTQYKRVFDYDGTATIDAGTPFDIIIISNFYQNNTQFSSTSLRPLHFLCTATSRVSAAPYVTDINQDRSSINDLSFRVNLGYNVPVATNIFWRILYTY